MPSRWSRGEAIVRREVLGLSPIAEPGRRAAWHDRAWFGCPVLVVEDSSDQLVTYLPPGAAFGFGEGAWPTPDGRHPWSGRSSWAGHSCLMVQRPADHHAVWHFWDGPDRVFSHWYINLQTAFRRGAIGYDTQDLELDLVVRPDGSWERKDLEVLPDRVREGRFSQALVDRVVDLGEELAVELDAGRHWWDHAWAVWTPDPSWRHLPLPPGWDDPHPS